MDLVFSTLVISNYISNDFDSFCVGEYTHVENWQTQFSKSFYKLEKQ